MNPEEDTYSAIFSALKHPLRRRILRMLDAAPLTYTEILNELSIEKGLLNYHLESLRELVTKEEDRYTLSEFGKAGLALIERVEEPVENRPFFMSSSRGSRRLEIMALLLAIGLVVSVLVSGITLVDNQRFRKDLEKQSAEITNLESYLHAYTDLFDSNIKPPVSKLEAVAIALSSDNWNSSSLKGMEVSASLAYVRFFYSNNSWGFEFLHYVNESVNDYSPRVEYDVPEPGRYTLVKGTMWYRYVWIVSVQASGPMRSIPPPGYYYVDASSGEIIPHGIP